MFKTLAISLVVAASLAGGAVAADRVPDTQFLKASRCAGLMKSSNLGASDGAALDAFLKEQQRRRPAAILDMADRDQKNARFEANRAKGEAKTRLIAEREGVCRGFLPDQQVAAAGA